MKEDKRVIVFLKREKRWKQEMHLLRDILRECELEEDFKWMHPCYTNRGNNIALIHGFKDYCALLFHKGALLQDTETILVQQTKNTQIARQIRFTTLQEIEQLKSTIKRYIQEAIENAQEGKEVELKKTSDYEKPKELLEVFKDDPDFKKAFYSLTPGRQRGYLLYFSSAKQSQTRTNRIGKSKSKIHLGKGYNER